MAKKTKRIPYLDYECKVGERVMWRTIVGKPYEGVLEEWDNNTAIVKLDNGETMAVNC